jgi:hypothetical protein
MTIDERARHELFLAVEHHLGPSQAETLMGMLPPVGWADVATKHDLAALEERIDLRFESIDLRFESIDLRFDAIDLRFDAIDRRFESLDPRFESIEHRILGELDRKLNQQTRTLFFGVVGMQATMVALIAALLR